ncbi:OLC1v1015991C1 [Oldenlandia corymbosa var. corymbosa]|uniref:OLC1v1015991C1 n=1 Tax=Oldenlandia corymbosa var. corymbosa TaxID=529605 RepID=A0AAV1E779_OLDCO|nr:OLC1v1015991C1 [Oldenlandia corymbosa var. corymbosa]
MGIKQRFGNIFRKGTRSLIAPAHLVLSPEIIQQGQWANLPPDLLQDIIQSIEETETSWPDRAAVVYCASVCKSWRETTKETVRTLAECGRFTFPDSLKHPGPRNYPIQCFIIREPTTSVYRLYLGRSPTEDADDKFLLSAKKFWTLTGPEFVISLVGDDFSRASGTYVGSLRSNFLGNKFTIYDNQHLSRRYNAKKSPESLDRCKNNSVATISHELSVFRARGPRRIHCVMNSITVSSMKEGGGKVPVVLKNKAPRWREESQAWCLDFKGRVLVASAKNFQLLEAVDTLNKDVPQPAEQEKIILQFGKFGKDIFTMDYQYPLSAFEAFAICLSNFGCKAIP